MNGVKLAPLTGLTATNKKPVQLESLASVIATHSISTLNIRNDNVIPSIDRDNIEKPITNISGAIAATIDSSAQTNENICNDTLNPQKQEKRLKTDCYSPLNVSDVNSLRSVYLKQQEDMGVDISDKQAMAKAYHILGKKEIKVLKQLSRKSDAEEDTTITTPQKKKVKIVKKAKIKKLVALPRTTGKPVNKRQKRKKMIRDELKRQLSMFTTLPETEGFPWKAIVSEKGYRNLKLEGWPNTISLTKRIDDFSPTELDKFEENLLNGTMKIVKIESKKDDLK